MRKDCTQARREDGGEKGIWKKWVGQSERSVEAFILVHLVGSLEKFISSVMLEEGKLNKIPVRSKMLFKIWWYWKSLPTHDIEKNTDLGTHHLQFQKSHADSITICHPINVRDYTTKNQSSAACPHLHSTSLFRLRSEYIVPSSRLPFIHQDLIKLSMLRNTRQKHPCGLGMRRGRSPEAEEKNNSSGTKHSGNNFPLSSETVSSSCRPLLCSSLSWKWQSPTRSGIQEQSASHCFGVRESSLTRASTCVPKCVWEREREREGEGDRNLPSDERELAHDAEAPHGAQEAADGHPFAETHHHSGLGKPLPELAQESVKALLPSVAVDFVWVGDAEAFLGGQLFESIHSALPIIPCPETTSRCSRQSEKDSTLKLE